MQQALVTTIEHAIQSSEGDHQEQGKMKKVKGRRGSKEKYEGKKGEGERQGDGGGGGRGGWFRTKHGSNGTHRHQPHPQGCLKPLLKLRHCTTLRIKALYNAQTGLGSNKARKGTRECSAPITRVRAARRKVGPWSCSPPLPHPSKFSGVVTKYAVMGRLDATGPLLFPSCPQAWWKMGQLGGAPSSSAVAFSSKDSSNPHVCGVGSLAMRPPTTCFCAMPSLELVSHT